MASETFVNTYSAVGTYDITVIALSGGTANATATETVTIQDDPVELPLTFESLPSTFVLGNFEANAAIVANPDPGASNTSSNVVSLEKTGTLTFGGVNITTSAPIDFSSQTGIRMKVLSPMPAGTRVTIKFETIVGFGGPALELDAFTTKVNEWETLYYDFSAIDMSEQWRNFVIFFDLGNAPTGDVNYFDDIEQADGPPIVLPLDFEDDRRQYNIGTNNAGFTILPNPVPGGINSSATVMEIDRPATGPNNFSLVAIVLDEAVEFDSDPIFKLKVYSPRVGLPVWLKFERVGDNSIAAGEIRKTTTVANQWEEIEYDFTGSPSDLDLRNVVIFFDPLNATSASEVIYIDDLIQTN